MLKNCIQEVYTNGGDPDVLMVGPHNRSVFSGFTAGATRYNDSSDKTLTATVDVYESDFGTLKVVTNRFQRDRTAFVLQSDGFELAWLRPIFVKDLAETGDHIRKEIIGEYALKVDNTGMHGAIRDLTTS